MNTGQPALAAPLACERLARSRQRLQQALLGDAATPVADWRNGLKSIPGFTLAMEVATAWWIRHPYRRTTVMVRDVANAAVLPTAQRHPLGLIAGAFVMGGLLAWSRPWRWFPLKAVLSIAARSE